MFQIYVDVTISVETMSKVLLIISAGKGPVVRKMTSARDFMSTIQKKEIVKFFSNGKELPEVGTK